MVQHDQSNSDYINDFEKEIMESQLKNYDNEY